MLEVSFLLISYNIILWQVAKNSRGVEADSLLEEVPDGGDRGFGARQNVLVLMEYALSVCLVSFYLNSERARDSINRRRSSTQPGD